MIKINIKHFVLLSIMFFGFSYVANANLEITEVMYNPEGSDDKREWVKIHNNGNNVINIISGRSKIAWRFGDGEDGNTLHYFNNDLSLNPDEYAIIASDSDTYISEYSYFGKIIDTTMSLGNKGIVTIWDGSEPRSVIYSKEYDENSVDNSSDNNTDNIVEEATDIISNNKDEAKVYKIVTKIISPKVVTAGIPFVVDHSTTGIKNEKIILGKFVWNFGDGMKKEGNTSQAFEYIYQYPGEYVLTLSYSDSSFDTVPDATDRLVVKVIPAGIIISSVGTSADPFIEIENNSGYEMSLYKWIVKGAVRSFTIPEGMVVLSNKKLKLSPRITGFDFNDLSSITIMDSSGQIFATYPNKIVPAIKYSASKNTNKVISENIIKSDIVENNQIENTENNPEVINLNDLGASASSLDGLNKLNKGFYAWLGLAGIIVIGAVSVFLLRRKDDYPSYDDGKISAKDMTIIE